MSTTNSPVRKPLAVKYPFVTESGQDYSDIDALLNDLCAQSGGYYLLGANNYWHGGIHITDEKFAHHKDKYPVRCMMDGEVIAYRLNQQYPTQSWQANPQLPAKTIRYSNGFCLVRHKYTSQSNQEEGAQNGKMNQLTFYSLYMHLADYKTYTADAAPEPKRVTITKDARARDPGRLSHSLGVLKHGSQILVDPAQTPQPFGSNQYYQVTIKTPAAGSEATLIAETQVCLYAGCFPDGTFLAAEKPKLPVYWKGTVTAHSKEPMKVYDTKENCIQRTVEPIARLNEQQTFTFQSDKVIRNVIVKGVSHTIAECQYPASATFGYEPCSSGWMIVDESQVTWDKLDPTEFDSIVKFSEPLPIFAGDPIGLIGVWESPKAPYTNNDIQSKMLMHVELFAADDKSTLDKFLSNEAGLKTGKKYLKVAKGSKLYSSDGDGGFVHPHELLSAARDYVFEESACAQVKDTAGTVFYNIKGIRNGEGATGPIDSAHVKIEGEVKLVTQHDWKELGFTTIEETNDNSDGYVDPDKIASPLFQDIFKKIDSSHDGVISSDEIQNALQRDKELRNDLCKMIAGHPSEWHRTTQTNMKTKFDELNAQNTDENYKKANQLELDKFLKCEFVSQIDGLTQKLWHFHPVLISKLLCDFSYPRTPVNDELIPLEFLTHYNQEKIEESDYLEAAETLGCEIAAIKAVSKTESGSSGSYFKFQTDDDFVPAILFERHHFHKYTNGIHDRYSDISNRDPGGYGEYRMQYPKLIKAYSLDKKAALMSVSWGKFQILASNYSSAGYSSPEEFVFAMSASEKNQLKAFVSFIQSNRTLLQAIRAKNWLTFAKTYNGPRQNGYDLRMEQNYNESL